MKKKYKIVFTHMNSTHWEVEAYSKDEATQKGLELSEGFFWSDEHTAYMHNDQEKSLLTIPDIQLLAVEEQVE